MIAPIYSIGHAKRENKKQKGEGVPGPGEYDNKGRVYRMMPSYGFG